MFAQGALFGCEVTAPPNPSPLLYKLDETDGSTISTVSITLDGNDVDGCNGLATNPITGQTWIIIREGSSPGTRTLATIDTSTGTASTVGVLDDNYAGIAFDPAGTLYGITGDGANTPETLFTLDLNDASSTFFMTLGNGNEGESIAIDNQCVLHHGSGISDGDRFYERIDLVTQNVLFSGQQTGPDVNDELLSMVFNPSTQRILTGDRFSQFFDITSTGVSTKLGDFDDELKGLAFEQPFAGLPVDTNCDGDLDLSIGGEIIPIGVASLILAGAQANALWILPVALAGAGLVAFKLRRN